jgi:hypothetical protein
MTNRKFKIVEDSYWTDNGCSCCEPDKWTIYKVYETLPDGTEKEVYTNGTPHYIEDAYSGILNHLGVEVEMVYEGS